jgi:hypothetical protein
MALRFTMRSSDLKRLRNAIDVNRCPEEGEKWIMYLEVSPSIAQFSFGGQRIQYPIDGKSIGYAKFPDFAISEATRWFLDKKPQAELEVSVGHGWLRCVEGTSHTEIEVGYIRDARTHRIHYTTDAELMALGQMVEDFALLNPALPQHIREASDNIMGSVYRAASELRKRGVMQDEVEAEVYIQVLVHEKLEAIKPTLRERFDTLGIENLWKS